MNVPEPVLAQPVLSPLTSVTVQGTRVLPPSDKILIMAQSVELGRNSS